MNLHNKLKNIILTNDKLEIIKEFENINPVVKNYNSLASNQIKMFEDKIYYNPVLSEKIYAIDLDGNKTLIFDDYDTENDGISKRINLVQDQMYNSYES